MLMAKNSYKKNVDYSISLFKCCSQVTYESVRTHLNKPFARFTFLIF